MSGRLGTQIGRYRLTGLLGQGGFAEVYLGTHLYLGTQAAVKLLLAPLATAREVEKFRQEAQTIATLAHPHIVRVLEFGVEAGVPYLVLDYAPSGSLRERHPAGTRVPLANVVTYVQQVAQALQHAHNHKIIHRDIKPQNLLVGRDGAILLTDFGISVMAESASRQQTGEFAGTITYAAPEQMRGKPRPVSDQYSLAVVVYEWLSGQPPFRGTLLEVIGQHAQTPPPSLRTQVPDLPPAVEEVVFTALAKAPQDRFLSVQAFATALALASQAAAPSPFVPAPPQNRVIPPPAAFGSTVDTRLPPIVPALGASTTGQGAPAAPAPAQSLPLSTAARPAPQLVGTPIAPAPPFLPGTMLPAPSEPARGGGISRRAVIVVLGLAGVTAASGGIIWWLNPQKRGSASGSNPPGVTSTPGHILYTYRGHSGDVQAVAWSLDGQRIASASADKTVQVWDAITGANSFIYQRHTDYVNAVAWSPDRKPRIASGSWDNTVQVWDAAGGGNLVTHTHQGARSGVNTITWSPNATRLASGGYDQLVEVWDASTGTTAFAYRGHMGYGSSAAVYAVAWSPDGNRLASAGGIDNRVHTWDASDGGNVQYYLGHQNSVNGVSWSPHGTRLAAPGGDGTVRIWDTNTRNLLLTYRGPADGSVFSVAWSPDSKRLASANYDGTVHVWDASNGANPFIYRGHRAPVTSVAWSPDGKLIATGSRDRTVQVWQA